MDTILRDVALKIRTSTENLAEHEFAEEHLPSAQDIAREGGHKLDKVKKRLKTLVRTGLINVVSFSPKRYRFNEYAFDELEGEDEMRILFEFESP